ncbi:oligosaccharide flippase family protein [Priestia megaterium]|uniref:oligosaccharide flippase family protein n=1 Tax=Priestia megaterium TaxID=1404 RepID=UPI0036DD751D
MKKLIKNRLIGNIVSLLILQGSNYIFPLITFPYLVRTLGASNYGVLLLCIAIMQFLNIFIDYGFNISGTREISINKYKREKVNEIYNLIMTVKLILTLIVGVFYFFAILIFSTILENEIAFLLSFFIIIGNTLFPIWLYQGMEQMKYITYINIFVKCTVTVLIFLFIQDNNDTNLAVLFQTFYYLIPGIISLFVVKRKFNISFKVIYDKNQILNELVKGKYIFMTNLWINFYSQGPIIILGFLSGNAATGNFGVGQKIMGAFYGLSQPVVQAIYPYMCELYKNKREMFNNFKRKFLFLSSILSLIISIFLYFAAPFLAKIVVGVEDDDISNLIKFFSIIVYLSIMNTIMARIMYAMNLQKYLNKSYSIAAFIFVIFAIPLTIFMNGSGMAIAVISAEATIFTLNIVNLNPAKISIMESELEVIEKK